MTLEDVGPWMTKYAIVTGGSGRVGPIWMEELYKLGYIPISYDLPEYDVTNLQQARDFVNELAHPPQVLINNAAIDNPPGSGATFFGNAKQILDVNVVGATNMAEAVIPRMVAGDGGVIVNIGSIMGNIGADWRNYDKGFEKPVAYNLSKAALIQLSRSITVQYGRYGIRSVTLAFGPLDEGLPDAFKERFLKNVPLGRAVSENSWRAALRFAIECPEFAGQQVLIDGGYVAW